MLVNILIGCLQRPRITSFGLSIAAVCILFITGCNDGRPKRVPVAGVVLIDGQPLSSGELMFVPEGTRPSSSEIGADGRFNLTCFDGGDGAVTGTHRVQVYSADRTSSGTKWHAPKKYTDFRTSGLTIEITEPTDDLTIELTWEGEKRSKKS